MALCVKGSPVREKIGPNVRIESLERFMSQSVIAVATHRAAAANEEIRDRVAACFGRVKRMLTYTIPRDREYVRCEVKDALGVYSIFSEQLAPGTNLRIQENQRDSHHAQAGVDANVDVPMAAGGLRAAHQQHSSDHSGHDLDVQAGRNAAIRIMIEGGKNGCLCFSPISELEVWVVMKRRDEQPREVSPMLDETMRSPACAQPSHRRHGRKRHHEKKASDGKPPFRL